MALGDDCFSKPDDDSGVTVGSVERKRIVRSEQEIKTMPTKQYLDEMVVPILNKALLKVNKDRPTNPIEFLGQHLLKLANEPPSPDESSKSVSSASTPTPLD